MPIRANASGERDSLDKASLIFVRKPLHQRKPKGRRPLLRFLDLGIGLAPGTRLRARLEAALSTAVKRTPVVAVIEYNYEQNGEIVVPA